MSWDIELDDQILQDLYAWIDQIPLSRPKKRIEKDFSDGGKMFASALFSCLIISLEMIFFINIEFLFFPVMVAELIKYYFPTWVRCSLKSFPWIRIEFI